MKFRHVRAEGPARVDRQSWRAWVIAGVGYGFSLAAIALFAHNDCGAASIPAWLDDAITEWNEQNEDIQIQFVDIKDSYVWYMIPDTPEIGHKDIRESIYQIVLEHGYKVTDEEERVTTAKPPSQDSPHKAKKCWTRSFVLDIENMSNTTAAGRGGGARPGLRQRMLTSLVCEDRPYWFTGFRILQ